MKMMKRWRRARRKTASQRKERTTATVPMEMIPKNAHISKIDCVTVPLGLVCTVRRVIAAELIVQLYTVCWSAALTFLPGLRKNLFWVREGASTLNWPSLQNFFYKDQ